MLYNLVMKKLTIFTIVILLMLCTILSGCVKPKSKFVYGVWWWDYSLNENYLDFAIDNNINEIYFCDQEFNNLQIVQLMKENNIDVYWLIGEKEWLLDFESVKNMVERYINYSNGIYSGIQLDVEPHQFDDFEQNRTTYLYDLIDMAHYLKQSFPDIKFDYCIPFWLDDEITYDGMTKPAYKHMIDVANRVILMSYRDSASGMIDVSKEEIEYANKIGKTIILGAEASESEESDIVTYFEEGKIYMKEQLKIVEAMLPQNFGISIHHITSWKQLKN